MGIIKKIGAYVFDSFTPEGENLMKIFKQPVYTYFSVIKSTVDIAVWR